MTLGTVVVTERGVGFDKTFSKLPVLLVDDFYDITSELLHSAYVEAIYNVNNFQFEKLTYQFWYQLFDRLADTGIVFQCIHCLFVYGFALHDVLICMSCLCLCYRE